MALFISHLMVLDGKEDEAMTWLFEERLFTWEDVNLLVEVEITSD